MKTLLLAAIVVVGVLMACTIKITSEPILLCIVDGDTLYGVPGDTIRCAPYKQQSAVAAFPWHL